MHKEQIDKDKDTLIAEKNRNMNDVRNTLCMHEQLLFHSTVEHRRCLGEYEKLSEEKSNQEYEALIKEGRFKAEDARHAALIFKQKAGNY